MNRGIKLAILFVLFVQPSLLTDLAMMIRIIRYILARGILDLWAKGGSMSGQVTAPIHKWLRYHQNGGTKEWVDELLTKIDIS